MKFNQNNDDEGKKGANEGGCSKMKFDLCLRDYLQKLSLFLQASNNAVPPLLEGFFFPKEYSSVLQGAF